jgi:NADPH-dependent FMN reductase
VSRIIGISGSLRRGSFNTALLRAAVELTPDSAELRIESIGGIPLYNGDVEDAEGIPRPIAELKKAITEADGLLLATPEYNKLITGCFEKRGRWAFPAFVRHQDRFWRKSGRRHGGQSGKFWHEFESDCVAPRFAYAWNQALVWGTSFSITRTNSFRCTWQDHG